MARSHYVVLLPARIQVCYKTVQISTRVSLVYLNFGRHLRTQIGLKNEFERDQNLLVETAKPEEWIAKLEKLEYLRELVNRYLIEAHAKQKKYYDRGRKQVNYRIGDWVMRKTHHLSDASKNFSAKLANKYEEPMRIVGKVSDNVYVLEDPDGTRIPKAHVTELIPYCVVDKDKEIIADELSQKINEEVHDILHREGSVTGDDTKVTVSGDMLEGEHIATRLSRRRVVEKPVETENDTGPKPGHKKRGRPPKQPRPPASNSG